MGGSAYQRGSRLLLPVPAAPRGGKNQDIFKRFHFFQTAGGAERNAGQRIVGDGDRQARGRAQHVIQVAEQCAAAGEHDPVGSKNSNLLSDPDFTTEMLADQRAARPV